MEPEYRNKQRKSYVIMRMTYDITFSLVILAVGVVMVFGKKLNISYVLTFDPLIRYMFGGLCLLYGSFRFYRGIKRNY